MIHPCFRDCLRRCPCSWFLGGDDKDFSQLFDWFVNQKTETSCQRGCKRSSDGWRIDGVYLRYPNHPVRGHLSFFFLTHAVASACRLINNNKFVLDTNYCFPGNCEARRMKSGNLLIAETLHNLTRANKYNAFWVFCAACQGDRGQVRLVLSLLMCKISDAGGTNLARSQYNRICMAFYSV